MAGLLLKDINKIFPTGVQAVFDVNLEVKDGEFIVLVGPSGCGKSTTLRLIAGLEEISSGELYIDGKLVNDAPPKDRDVAMVFQNYALLAHYTVYKNMAFPLEVRRVPKAEIDKRVRAVAEILGITEYLSRKPKELSGGQKQRVAIGRAIVREPKVFLFDEPLSNLDAKLRASMRTEIAKLYARLKTTFIYVTHDQVEAMTMGTRIVVMKDGFVQQVDTPQNLYDYPINVFVAGFIGTPCMNFFKNVTLKKKSGKVYAHIGAGNRLLLPATLLARINDLDAYLDTGKPIILGVRAEDIHHEKEFLENAVDATIKARIEVVENLGAETQIYCEIAYADKESAVLDDSTQMIARVSSREEALVGDVVKLAFDVRHVHLFDEETERTILQRDEDYEYIAENKEASYMPPTPQEMKEKIQEKNKTKKKK